MSKVDDDTIRGMLTTIVNYVDNIYWYKGLNERRKKELFGTLVEFANTLRDEYKAIKEKK